MREDTRQFRERLKKEGRWGEFVAERKAIVSREGCTNSAAKKKILYKYLPGVVAADPNQSGEDRFKNKLPDGTPIIDEDIWKGKPKIGIIDEFEWVHENLGKKNVEMKDAPSLGAWRIYYGARYTAEGMTYFRGLYERLVIPDKAALRDRQGRRDDGRLLQKLGGMLESVTMHEQSEKTA